MDEKTKQIINLGLKALLIRIVLFTLVFWLLANVWNGLNGSGFFSLEKSLFIILVFFAVVISIRLGSKIRNNLRGKQYGE